MTRSKTPEEQIEQEQEHDRLRLESLATAELRELYDRIGAMLRRYPHDADPDARRATLRECTPAN